MNHASAFDSPKPYGPLIETRLRVVTWNVQGQEWPWRARQPVIANALAAEVPDLVALQESWADASGTQAAELAAHLGLHHASSGADGIAASGNAVLARWPIVATHHRTLPGRDEEPGLAFAAEIDGPRGPIALVSIITGSCPPVARPPPQSRRFAPLFLPRGQSADRQDQVRALAEFVAGLPRRALKIVCGDFNAPPDSDEIRMLTGRAAVPVPGQVFYDAWAIAGTGPGLTWTSANPSAAPALLEDRRIDYVLTPWPRRGAQGHPVAAALVGAGDTTPAPSDHYGVRADLRYRTPPRPSPRRSKPRLAALAAAG
jgi:endonuclease/exonuclease/phosphatase family metal-dependent hydrolase